MSDAGVLGALALGLAAGAGGGAVFFIGLWWTVRAVTAARAPALLLALSFVARCVLLCALFWLVAGHSALALAACLAGFIAARAVITRRLRVDDAQEAASCG